MYMYVLVLVLFKIAFWPFLFRGKNLPTWLSCYLLIFLPLGHGIIEQMALVKVQTCADKGNISVKWAIA